MMNLRLRVTAVAIAALVVPASALAFASGATSAARANPLASTQTVDWQIPLVPGQSGKGTGSSQYQAQPGQRELQVEVEHLRSLAHRRVLVQVNGARVGWATVSRNGVAQLSRNTELGQRVSAISHGPTVTVRTGTGRVLLSGSY
jgi:hypothetical protein